MRILWRLCGRTCCSTRSSGRPGSLLPSLLNCHRSFLPGILRGFCAGCFWTATYRNSGVSQSHIPGKNGILPYPAPLFLAWRYLSCQIPKSWNFQPLRTREGANLYEGIQFFSSCFSLFKNGSKWTVFQITKKGSRLCCQNCISFLIYFKGCLPPPPFLFFLASFIWGAWQEHVYWADC